MGLQIGDASESLAAVIAQESLDARVHGHVGEQALPVRILLGAQVALVRLVVRVPRLQVRLVLCLHLECLAALVALVRCVCLVKQHVRLENTVGKR